MALIQAALDTLDYELTIKLAKDISPYVDIIELGTPCIKYNGIRLLKELRAIVPISAAPNTVTISAPAS